MLSDLYGRDKTLPLTNVLDAADRHAFDAQMVVFYNDDLSIVAQDDLSPERLIKFRAFLNGFWV